MTRGIRSLAPPRDAVRPFITTNKTRLRTAAWPAVYFAVVAGALLFFFRGWTYDDPYITYRYAANLAEGQGFVYNPGERVLSTTSPLLALVLAVPALLGAELPPAANFIGAVSLAAGGLLLWEIARRLEAPAAGWICAALYPASALLVGTLGSETPLYLALCLGAAAAYLRRQYAPAAVLLGLGMLARPDAGLFAALLAVDWLARAFRERGSLAAVVRAVPLRALLAGAAVLLPWAVFGWAYFGSPVPETLAARQAHGLRDPVDGFLPGLWMLLQSLAGFPHYWLLFAMAAAGLILAVRSRPRWLLLALWPVFFSLGYALLGVTRNGWYYASLVPGLVAAAGLALGTAIGSPVRQGAAAPRRTMVAALGWTVFILLMSGQLFDLARLHLVPDRRAPIYRAVGQWLAENVPPDASVATLEVGTIGYYARPRPMIDFTGLLQPEIHARFHPGYTYAESSLWAAERYQPDVFVLVAGHFPGLRSSYLPGRCVLAALFEGPAYGYDQDLLVYVCG